ncbi:hypothetical protein HYH02_000349 [Chlamydomonas schloesseri]|uniref:non-specific serine/threonine protein kinase n=1 Tax=Chlamydomonas schloesseri TaxID=2026947 RepID=A0A835WW38_9CHLO|nr:hypothetical protein HYH02_000349 [Chlamydomonas schloesseri]|eukprot:KAG2454502.1 hypothetical protein HYH02_000349 [Chlamydomonas schloesseri]
MLQDATNAPGHVKVFARRRKFPAGAEAALTPAGRLDTCNADSSGASPPLILDRSTSFRTSGASETSHVAPLPGPAGWRRCLDSRRTSVLVPPGPAASGGSSLLLLDKADWLARRYMPARQRESRNAAVAAVLSEMRAYYDEVDREELVVESPDASPVKGAAAKHSSDPGLVEKLSALSLSRSKIAGKAPTAAHVCSPAASPADAPATHLEPTVMSSRADDAAPAPAAEDSAGAVEAVQQAGAGAGPSRPSSCATRSAAAAGSAAAGQRSRSVAPGVVAVTEALSVHALDSVLRSCSGPSEAAELATAARRTTQAVAATQLQEDEKEEEGGVAVGLASRPTASDVSAGSSAAAAADLSPLQRLLLLCGQEPHLPRDALPTMDDLIDSLAQQLAAGQLGAGGSRSAVAPPSSVCGAAAGADISSVGGRATRAARQAKRGAADAAAGATGPAGNARVTEPAASVKRPLVVKVGEGSYGEAWRLGGSQTAGRPGAAAPAVVVKVVPIEGTQDFNGGPQKTAADMQSETLMCRELSALGAAPGSGVSDHFTSGFVRTHTVAVCRGPYSKELVKAWEKWDAQHGSENEPVSELPADQLYWCIAMEDSGTDLEKYDKLESWDQLRSVLLQVAVSLAVSESALAFEHRDLHWGNVLIRPHAPTDGSAGCMTARLRGHTIKVSSCGLVATIIDFTNSRLQAADGTLAFCDLEADPAVFEGTRGDVQFDTYRWMRAAVERDWSASCPETNCLWVSYLAEVLAVKFGGGGAGAGAGKGGKKGAAALGLKLSTAQKRELREFRKRAVACSSCGDLLMDTLFRGLMQLEQ